ncbi:MAG: O-antigen ligase family protein [Flavobacteriales bacterium]|nr:O-antigen ligase family protein [Flavobacteriales bacterium]MDW8409304.1 O-antigen ligase family protein [Flavobacteriales bacterium]
MKKKSEIFSANIFRSLWLRHSENGGPGGLFLTKAGLMCLTATAPWPWYFVHSAALVLSAIGCLLLIFQRRCYFRPLLLFWIIGATCILGCLSSLRHGFYQAAFPDHYFFWLTLPLIHSLSSPDERPLLANFVEREYLVLALSTSAVVVFASVAIFSTGFQDSYLAAHTLSYKLRNEFSIRTGIHPPYFGMFALASIVFFINRAYTEATFWVKALWTGLASFLLISLVFLETRIHLMALIAFFLLQPKYRWAGMMLLSILTLYIVLVPSTRFMEIVQNQKNSATLRAVSWQCGWQVFQSKPWTGVGPLLQEDLNTCYLGRDPRLQNMNTHNQFLHLAAAHGFTGLLLFLGFWGAVLRMLRSISSWLASANALALFLFCLTENVAERQWGTIMLGLFSAWLPYFKFEGQK